jgi:hypothetical protein
MKPAFDTTLDDLDFDVLLMRPQRAQPRPRLTASGFIGLASLRDAGFVVRCRIKPSFCYGHYCHLQYDSLPQARASQQGHLLHLSTLVQTSAAELADLQQDTWW